MQPVHGYDVRRELVSWRLEGAANVKPGSIYSAIRTLEKDGFVAVHSRESDATRPEKVRYVTTAEGEKEFIMLLRESWWTVSEPAEPLIPALCLVGFVGREELMRALQTRIGVLEGLIAERAFIRGMIRDGANGADGEIPEHVREILDFLSGRTRAEIDWARSFLKRLRDGEYAAAIPGRM